MDPSHHSQGRHAVLAVVSHGCPPPEDRSLRVTHPSATAGSCPPTVRLACVKHAASVRSEPGSNSQVHLKPRHNAQRRHKRDHQRTDPNSLSPHPLARKRKNRRSLEAYCNASKRHINQRPKQVTRPSKSRHNQTTQTNQATRPPATNTHMPVALRRRQRIPS